VLRLLASGASAVLADRMHRIALIVRRARNPPNVAVFERIVAAAAGDRATSAAVRGGITVWFGARCGAAPARAARQDQRCGERARSRSAGHHESSLREECGAGMPNARGKKRTCGPLGRCRGTL
jgi:hypothetical protein